MEGKAPTTCRHFFQTKAKPERIMLHCTSRERIYWQTTRLTNCASLASVPAANKVTMEVSILLPGLPALENMTLQWQKKYQVMLNLPVCLI